MKNSRKLRSLASILCFFLAAGRLAAQQKVAATTPVLRTATSACGDYPATGKEVRAISILTAGEKCNTTIVAGLSKVIFSAGETIVLSPGFSALSGSTFIARIDSTLLTDRSVALPNTAQNEPAQNLLVSPNPSSGNFVATIKSTKSGKAQVSLYNASGVLVKRLAGVQLVEGINRLSLNYPDIPSGIYTLEVNLGDSRLLQKLVRN